jgi:hypothetical protein
MAAHVNRHERRFFRKLSPAERHDLLQLLKKAAEPES